MVSQNILAAFNSFLLRNFVRQSRDLCVEQISTDSSSVKVLKCILHSYELLATATSCRKSNSR